MVRQEMANIFVVSIISDLCSEGRESLFLSDSALRGFKLDLQVPVTFHFLILVHSTRSGSATHGSNSLRFSGILRNTVFITVDNASNFKLFVKITGNNH